MKRLTEQDQVRPGFIVAALAIVAAVLGFVVVNFLFLGDAPEPEPSAPPAVSQPQEPAPTPTPIPEEEVALGQGRDPFQPAFGAPAPAEVQQDVAAVLPTTVEVVRLAEDGSVASVRVNDVFHERARPGDQISEGIIIESIDGNCVNFLRGEDQFQVCQGETAQVATT